MKPTKSDYEYFFNAQFANSMCSLNKNRPYASFGPITIKYEPTECGPFTEIKWGVYLFDAEQNFRLPKSTCPIGNLTPVMEQHFDYMPFAQEIWYKYGDQICTELDKYFNIAKAYKRK